MRVDDLVAMADALLGAWSPHAQARGRSLDDLVSAVAARGHRRGVMHLREALALARPDVRSPQETTLRLLVTRNGLPEPECNADVVDDRGRWIGMSDLVWRGARLVVEYEGDHHRVDPEQFEKDIRRRERYADAAWRMVRVTKRDLDEHPVELIGRVKRAYLGSAWA